MQNTLIVILLGILMIIDPDIACSQIPSSARSGLAVKKYTPVVEKEFEEKGLTAGSAIFMRIFKVEKILEIWIKNGSKYEMVKSFPVCYYSGTLGTKTKENDGQSPEGFYRIYPKQLNPYSRFHLSFNIGYPNEYERKKGFTGSAIMVHGSCVSIGCYAMTDEGIEEIWTIVDKAFRNGQQYFDLQVFPFKLTDETLTRYRNSEWYDFWVNLKEGFDYFEKNRVPPEVYVQEGRYKFR